MGSGVRQAWLQVPFLSLSSDETLICLPWALVWKSTDWSYYLHQQVAMSIQRKSKMQNSLSSWRSLVGPHRVNVLSSGPLSSYTDMGAKDRYGLAVTHLSRAPQVSGLCILLFYHQTLSSVHTKGKQGDPEVGSLEIDWTTQWLGTKEIQELGKETFAPLVCGGLFAPHEWRVSQWQSCREEWRLPGPGSGHEEGAWRVTQQMAQEKGSELSPQAQLGEQTKSNKLAAATELIWKWGHGVWPTAHNN